MRKIPLKSALLLGAAVVLLGASVSNSTYAALSVVSDYYDARVAMKEIGVTIRENGKDISWRNYKGSDDEWDEVTGSLLKDMPTGKDLELGKTYPEKLTIKNTGDIPTYVRIALTLSWKNKQGEVDMTLDPSLIRLNIKEGNGWRLSKEESSAERIVLYYDKILGVGEESPAFTDGISIDPILKTRNTSYETTRTEGNKVYTDVEVVYDYDGYSFDVTAAVDSVQTHNEADAKTSAWGVGNDDTTLLEEGEEGEVVVPDEPSEPDEPDEPQLENCPVCGFPLTDGLCDNITCDYSKDGQYWKCPDCGLWNKNSSDTCDCGHRLIIP